MRLAVPTPVVTLLPSVHAPWEETATIEDVARIAQAADRLGYHHLTCSEHVGVPAREAARRGARYFDPLATFGFLASRTERIRLATNVLVLGYHHPLEIAKRYGTLDVISGGRVILGLGVGTLREEFDLLGAPFDDRGLRADDALRALRASLSRSTPSYKGDHYSFGDLVVDPCAMQDRLPLWVGGRTVRSLRRALSLADGWCPFGVTPAQANEWIKQEEVPPGFEIVLGPELPLNPIQEPDAAGEGLAALAAAGATIASARLVHRSRDHYIEQLEALAAVNNQLHSPS
ncbi:TIGR03619 family F420-dependent LLM class oxidoreductase [Frankia sp. CNm7]|nr:TIGR03619 family F420-dependent LLM class oxidoreductase [Frankia nepalensis]MBL7498010.1 TIGR03619 family F420-dependent LLM class oxidoreductase [Frankia nepalensis]MBL7509092.1 TIGR03619 family F420-dependent LLM class oxidoreductase [Frankia nepalensis]MBL7516805.1 TIGR03619 family F420-dependent LLM class oxidoreductase [Frankia nepalensis]